MYLRHHISVAVTYSKFSHIFLLPALHFAEKQIKQFVFTECKINVNLHYKAAILSPSHALLRVHCKILRAGKKGTH